MFSSFATGPSRKRPRKEASKQISNKNGLIGDPNALCNFCGQMTAAVAVDMPVSVGRKRTPTSYCLICYYTTTAVRQDPQKYVHTLDEAALQEQLPPLQDLFSQVYVDLSKEVAEASEKAFAQMKDPLASLRGTATKRVASASTTTPRRMSPKELAAKKAGKETDGGFLRPVKVPLHLSSPTNKGNGDNHVQSSITNFMTEASRRKPTRRSIWNLAMDKTIRTDEATKANAANPQPSHDAVCTCGSKNVQLFGNMTSRNQDLKKGETWGMKDRGEDVVSRYQCNDCGKLWNEAG
eukprot:Nitzschia sp. Nitz4//scaffold195_size40117//260//1141//NITZ4_007571-RA/size40117-processed-gene-0.20-mRNA-1//-1//CDS//3329540350//414//frame0